MVLAVLGRGQRAIVRRTTLEGHLMKSARRRSDCVLSVEVLEDRSLLSALGPNVTPPAPVTASAHPTITVLGTARPARPTKEER